MKIASSRSFLAIVALVAALVFVPSATAQNASTGTYGGQGGEVLTDTNSGGPSDPGSATATASSADSLPFTGLDVTLLAGGGLLLLGIGIGMSRLVARQSIS